MIDINELRRLAQSATPGLWHFWRGWVAADIDNDGGVIIAERPTPSGGKYQARVDSNFKFIAAANPTAISELLDRLEAAEGEVESIRQGISFRDDVVAALAVERDALRAKIEQMERQEPVWFIDERGEPKRYHKSKADYCKYGGLDLLYALPGARGEEK